jgi:hypothetical protein
LNDVTPNGTTDRYAYRGTYHGVVHSHLDAVDCHVLYEGKGYNGVTMEALKAAGGCPKGSITALKDGVVTRAILFDATKLPGKATAQSWIEPGTAIHREDLEAMEKMEHVKVAPGDVILLYTGRWKRRPAMGAWGRDTGYAGYHADVAYFLKERGVSFIGFDGPNDVMPSGLPPRSEFLCTNWRSRRWAWIFSTTWISKGLWSTRDRSTVMSFCSAPRRSGLPWEQARR